MNIETYRYAVIRTLVDKIGWKKLMTTIADVMEERSLDLANPEPGRSIALIKCSGAIRKVMAPFIAKCDE